MSVARRPAVGNLARLLASALVFSAFAVLPMALAAGVAGMFGNFPFSLASSQTPVGATAAQSACSATATAVGHPSASERAASAACSGTTGATAPVQSVHLTAPSRPEGR